MRVFFGNRQFLPIAILFLSLSISAQSRQEDFEKRAVKKNTVYAELLGNAGYGLYSVNYDRLFPFKRSGGFTLRVGASYRGQGYTLLSFPVMAGLVTGKNSGHFEFAGGAVLHSEPAISAVLAAPTATIGYRYQPPEGGPFFKVGYTPVFYNINESQYSWVRIIFWADCGLSFGYTF
jgi:hypothetical protein